MLHYFIFLADLRNGLAKTKIKQHVNEGNLPIQKNTSMILNHTLKMTAVKQKEATYH